MNKYKAAAIEVLQKSKEPLHYKEITKRALEMGILETSGATPDQSMGAQLFSSIKKNGKDSEFIQTSTSTFTLNPSWKPPSKKEPVELEEDPEEKIQGGYTGKGGEHFICSELLFRGFNASIMSVDVGMDIVATKENDLFSIQVKTANLSEYGVYNFDVRKTSFERKSGGKTFYIFVLRGKDKTNCLILPFSEMERKVSEKAILPVGGGKRYRVVIKFRDENVYLGSLKNEMNYFLNKWEIIK